MGIEDSEVKVIPWDGYGNDQIVRQLIDQEKPMLSSTLLTPVIGLGYIEWKKKLELKSQ